MLLICLLKKLLDESQIAGVVVAYSVCYISSPQQTSPHHALLLLLAKRRCHLFCPTLLGSTAMDHQTMYNDTNLLGQSHQRLPALPAVCCLPALL